MSFLLLGNIFSFGAALCIAVSVMKKSKKDLIGWQILDTSFCILSASFLNSYSSVSTNSIALVRNILAYTNKLNKVLTGILLVVCIIVGLYVNNRGLIGILPVAATAEYTILIYTTKNEQQMRYALIVNLLMWFGHDIYIQAYPTACTDMILSIWTAIQAFKSEYGKKQILKHSVVGKEGNHTPHNSTGH